MFWEVKPLHAVKNNISFQHQLPSASYNKSMQNSKFKVLDASKLFFFPWLLNAQNMVQVINGKVL